MSKEDLERLNDQGMAAWDAHDADAWVDLFADDFVWYDWTRPEPIRDKQAAREHFNTWITAFPDMRTKTIDLVIGEDSVAAEIEFAGTNTGRMSMGGMEMPPTNKSIAGRGAYLYHVKDGKIVEFRAFPDAAGMMVQLGLMPQM
jgi:steroid delta-isomerase-like uncharacterized protein